MFFHSTAPRRKILIPYVPPSVIYALQAVKNAGGFAVLAHAFSYKRDSQIKLGTLIKLKNNGLGGLEVNHYEHNLKSRKDAYEISKNFRVVTIRFKRLSWKWQA